MAWCPVSGARCLVSAAWCMEPSFPRSAKPGPSIPSKVVQLNAMSAKADNATGYSIVVGSFLCVVCFMAGAFVWWHGGTVQTGQELGAEDEISGGRASLDAFEPGLAKPRGSGAPALVLGTDMSSGAGAQPLLSASSGHS